MSDKAIELTAEPQTMAVARIPSGSIGVNIEALLERAVDAKSAVEVLERLAVMRREMKAEAAKEAYDRALAAFQAECPVIAKAKAVHSKDGKLRYHYAPIDVIVAGTRELLQKHGFSYTLTAEVEDKWVTAVLKAKHQDGHAEESRFKVPIDPDAYMNAPQKFASALTFAKRYAFCNGFGILTGDADDDAQGADPEHDAGQDRRPPPAPRQSPAKPRPAKPATTAAAKSATDKTREWAIAELQKSHGLPIIREYLQQCGLLLPNEPLESWPLEYVPVSHAQLEMVRVQLNDFTTSGTAKKPGFVNPSPAPEKPEKKAAAPTKPVEVPRDKDAGQQAELQEIDPSWEKMEGAVAQVSVKNGTKKNGEPWTLYGIKIGDDWYNTFSNTVGKAAQAAKADGGRVRLYYTEDDEGRFEAKAIV